MAKKTRKMNTASNKIRLVKKYSKIAFDPVLENLKKATKKSIKQKKSLLRMKLMTYLTEHMR